MDFYLNTSNSATRLIDEYQKYGSIVVCYDFDDTVYDFHKKGRSFIQMINLLMELKSINCHLICWTGQEDILFVKKYLSENNIPFDAINENPPFYKSNSRKVYANAYLDDRAGLKQVYDELTSLVKLVKKDDHGNSID